MWKPADVTAPVPDWVRQYAETIRTLPQATVDAEAERIGDEADQADDDEEDETTTEPEPAPKVRRHPGVIPYNPYDLFPDERSVAEQVAVHLPSAAVISAYHSPNERAVRAKLHAMMSAVPRPADCTDQIFGLILEEAVGDFRKMNPQTFTREILATRLVVVSRWVSYYEVRIGTGLSKPESLVAKSDLAIWNSLTNQLIKLTAAWERQPRSDR